MNWLATIFVLQISYVPDDLGQAFIRQSGQDLYQRSLLKLSQEAPDYESPYNKFNTGGLIPNPQELPPICGGVRRL